MTGGVVGTVVVGTVVVGTVVVGTVVVGTVVVGSEVVEAGLFGSGGVGPEVPGCVVVGLGSMDGLPGTVGTGGKVPRWSTVSRGVDGHSGTAWRAG